MLEALMPTGLLVRSTHPVAPACTWGNMERVKPNQSDSGEGRWGMINIHKKKKKKRNDHKVDNLS